MRYLLIIALFFTHIFAELPPQVYKEWKLNAKEVLDIKVLSVNIKRDNNLQYLYIKAKVLNVISSKSQLKVGSTIEIHYTKKDKPNILIIGPTEPITLKKGHKYRAYLKRDSLGFYTLAAGGRSFE